MTMGQLFHSWYPESQLALALTSTHLLFWWLNPHSLLNLRCWWLTPRSSWWNHFGSKSPTPVYTIAIAHKIKTNPTESQVLILKIHIMSDVLSWFSQVFSMIFPWFSMVRIPISSKNTTTPLRERRTSRRRPCLAINLAQMPRSIARRAASKSRFIQKL